MSYMRSLEQRIKNKESKDNITNEDLHDLFHLYDLLDYYNYYANKKYYDDQIRTWKEEFANE